MYLQILEEQQQQDSSAEETETPPLPEETNPQPITSTNLQSNADPIPNTSNCGSTLRTMEL